MNVNCLKRFKSNEVIIVLTVPRNANNIYSTFLALDSDKQNRL